MTSKLPRTWLKTRVAAFLAQNYDPALLTNRDERTVEFAGLMPGAGGIGTARWPIRHACQAHCACASQG